MKKQSYFEKFLLLAVVLQVVSAGGCVLLGLRGEVVLSVVLGLLSAVILVWVIGRARAIYLIRLESNRALTMDELRAELIRTHDWWTGSQIDELITRYMAFQQGHFQKWLLDNVTIGQIEEEMANEGVAPDKQKS